MKLENEMVYDPDSPSGFSHWKKPKSAATVKTPKGWAVGYFNYRGYWHVIWKGRIVVSSRVVWEIHKGPIPKGRLIDHKDGNKSNNCIDNLRLATNAQNGWNRSSPAKRSELPKNIYQRSGIKPFEVSVEANGKKHYGGRFGTMDEAIDAARTLRERVHGIFSAS